MVDWLVEDSVLSTQGSHSDRLIIYCIIIFDLQSSCATRVVMQTAQASMRTLLQDTVWHWEIFVLLFSKMNEKEEKTMAVISHLTDCYKLVITCICCISKSYKKKFYLPICLIQSKDSGPLALLLEANLAQPMESLLPLPSMCVCVCVGLSSLWNIHHFAERISLLVWYLPCVCVSVSACAGACNMHSLCAWKPWVPMNQLKEAK